MTSTPIIAFQMSNLQLYVFLAITGFFVGVGTKISGFVLDSLFGHTKKIKHFFKKK